MKENTIIPFTQKFIKTESKQIEFEKRFMEYLKINANTLLNIIDRSKWN